MDLFRFTNPDDPAKMESGIIIEGVFSKMWVERYDTAGEFEVKGYIESQIREQLPLGSFVSHVGSDEIMVVEDHQIDGDDDGHRIVTVTGRGYEAAVLDQRIVGSDRSFPTSGALPEYTAPADYSWKQIVYMIRNHVYASELIDDNNAIPYLEVKYSVSGTSEEETRSVKRGPLYTRLAEILPVDNLGIKTFRPGRSDLATNPENVLILIHRGTDRSSAVVFDHAQGDVIDANYLWSIRPNKNAALVYGKWVDTMVFDGLSSELSRRVMHVDASDIDEAQETVPSGLTREVIVAAMNLRGRQALAAQREVALVKAEVSQETQSATYRQDYDVGDLVTVIGEYSETSTMRVSEHVEIEDEEGSRGYPTLVLP